MRLVEVVEASGRVRDARGRLEKIELLAELLGRTPATLLEIAVAFVSGMPRQGRIGVGPAILRSAWPDEVAATPTLELAEVDEQLTRIAAASGPGSTARRADLLRGLLSRATAAERDFLAALLLGELRQGALQGLVVEAVARAGGRQGAAVRRALAVTADLGEVARAIMAEDPGLDAVGIELFRPVQPMLAQSAKDLADALERLGDAALDYKLDGARVQIHKAGDDVAVFSRRLNEVTAAVPEIVEVARGLPFREAVLDGETIALKPDGRPHPFQVTMRRFGRKLGVERMRAELPLSVMVFDLLRLDGEDLLREPLERRLEALAEAPAELVIPRLPAPDPESAEAFLASALARGHEGVMAKALASPYRAGSRGGAWLKVKPVHTLDLVVLAAEWGHGRRKGWLSNLHLGARDPGRGFAMLGKTFKGMTDEMLAWQTGRLLELETGREGHVVHVRPELVVEVAFNDVQASPTYPSGLALRFARIRRYRPDKRAEQADTIDTVRGLHRAVSGGDSSG